jgi:hypothetical protein
MTTLGEVINELTKIQNAIDKTEVRGNENRRLLNEAYDRCNLLIDAINKSIQEIQNGSNSEEG